MQKIIEFAESFKQQVEKERQSNVSDQSKQPAARALEQEITVCLRFRPLLESEKAQRNFSCATLFSTDSVLLHKPEFTTRTTQPEPIISTEKITVDLAFGENDTNDDVFTKAAHDLVPLALGGGVGTLFAYGQTSSGKTHTLVGIQERVAKEIFTMADEYQKKFANIPIPSPEALLPPTATNKKMKTAIPTKATIPRKPLSSRTITKKPIGQKQEIGTKETGETKKELAENNATRNMQETQQSDQNNATEQAQQIDQGQPTEQTTQQKEAQDNGKRKLRIFVAFFELLGKNAFDLLADKKTISILEDKFGEIQLAGIVERQIFSPEEFINSIHSAAALRQSATTLRNDSSSRSHAMCRVRINNPLFPSSQDGLLLLVDLAGSERAADSREHSAERIAETKEINSSLMALKDCIRARATAGNSQEKFVHVPYRSSKLTVLLKDAFELSSMRSTQTVVIAHISPCATDVAHSLNTLRYVAPLKVRATKPVIDPKNPATWTHEQAVEWIREEYRGKVDASILCPYESGLQLCKVPESEYMRRILLNPGISEKQAKKFYMALWEMIVDARTRKRQETRKLDKTRQQERVKDMEENDKAMIERYEEEGGTL